MSDVFMVLIRGVYNINNYYAKVSCPSQYKTLHCEIVNWYIPFNSATDYNSQIAQLKCINGLVIKNSYENTNPLQTLAISNIKSLNIDYSPHIEFDCENFNNKVLEFSLSNENDEQISEPVGIFDIIFTQPWTLILKCKGYN